MTRMSPKHSKTAPIEASLAKALRLSVYAVAFVPLIIFPSFVSTFHFGKVVIFRSMVEILAVMYVALLWQDRSYLPRPNRIFWGVLVFTLAFTITTVTSINPHTSLWGTLERMGGLWTFWHYYVYFVIATSVLRTRPEWRRLLRTTVMISILSSMHGILQRTGWQFIIGSGGQERIFGTLGNPALFAGYEIVCFFLALMLYFDRIHAGKEKRSASDKGQGQLWTIVGTSVAVLSYLLFYKVALTQAVDADTHPLFWAWPLVVSMVWGISRTIGFGEERIWLPVAIVLDFIAIILTSVRGSFLALGVGLCTFIAMYYFQYRTQLTRMSFIPLGALAALAGIFFILLATPVTHDGPPVASNIVQRLWGTFVDTSQESYTLKTRIWAWKAGIKGWEESPKTILLGWGPEMFNIPFSKHFDPMFLNEASAQTFYDRAHNMFVEVLVTMGLLGLTAYLFMYWSLGKSLIEIRRQGNERMLGMGLVSLVVAYVIHNLFIFDTAANFLVFFTAMGFVSCVITPERRVAIPQPLPVAGLRVPALIAMAAIMGYLIWHTNVVPCKANYATSRAITMRGQGNFYGAAQAYLEAIAYRVPGQYEFRHGFAQFLIESLASEKMTPERTQMINVAIQEVQKNADGSPLDYLPLFHIGRLYITLGKDDPASPYNDEALKYSLAALALSPKLVRTYYEIAQAYLNKKDYDHAIEYFRQAAALNPTVGISYWYWGMTEFERGNPESGWRLVNVAFAKDYDPSEGDLLRLAVSNQKIGAMDRLVEIYQTLIRKAPAKSDYHATLAMAYARTGQTQRAIAAAKKAAQLDPKLEPKAREFVHQIGGQW
jgi:tetratricopeptide (TPR) repeat protein